MAGDKAEGFFLERAGDNQSKDKEDGSEEEKFFKDWFSEKILDSFLSDLFEIGEKDKEPEKGVRKTEGQKTGAGLGVKKTKIDEGEEERVDRGDLSAAKDKSKRKKSKGG